MARKAKTKASANPLANICAENLDRALNEVEATASALSHIDTTKSEQSRSRLERAAQFIREAKELAIETLEETQ